jgi:hypothetical protein
VEQDQQRVVDLNKQNRAKKQSSLLLRYVRGIAGLNNADENNNDPGNRPMRVQHYDKTTQETDVDHKPEAETEWEDADAVVDDEGDDDDDDDDQEEEGEADLLINVSPFQRQSPAERWGKTVNSDEVDESTSLLKIHQNGFDNQCLFMEPPPPSCDYEEELGGVHWLNDNNDSSISDLSLEAAWESGNITGDVCLNGATFSPEDDNNRQQPDSSYRNITTPYSHSQSKCPSSSYSISPATLSRSLSPLSKQIHNEIASPRLFNKHPAHQNNNKIGTVCQQLRSPKDVQPQILPHPTHVCASTSPKHKSAHPVNNKSPLQSLAGLSSQSPQVSIGDRRKELHGTNSKIIAQISILETEKRKLREKLKIQAQELERERDKEKQREIENEMKRNAMPNAALSPFAFVANTDSHQKHNRHRDEQENSPLEGNAITSASSPVNLSKKILQFSNTPQRQTPLSVTSAASPIRHSPLREKERERETRTPSRQSISLATAGSRQSQRRQSIQSNHNPFSFATSHPERIDFD